MAITPSTKALIIAVIIVHIMFFVLESIFWMNPIVYNMLLGFLHNPVTLNYPAQALVLKKLFINQGFYNLFLVCTGLLGLYLINKKQHAPGYIVLLMLCFSAMGAGVVLACSTSAYLLAFFQAVPAAFAFIKIYPIYKMSTQITGLN